MDQIEFSREIKVTNDGSTSIYVKELDEHYHSIHGAIQEAKHVFLRMGLDVVSANPVEILEIGFGTGLNCFLTALEGKNVNYHGIEAYPVQEDLISSLTYADQLQVTDEVFNKIHEVAWGNPLAITESFSLYKDQVKLEDVVLEPKYHLIYFDAFGPRAQGELWDVRWFKKLYESLVDGGVFVTYCAKGQVRRDLASVGFKMERLPGPPGKREMLRGIK